MKEQVEWEVCWLEPGGKLNTKKVADYNRALQEASSFKYKLRGRGEYLCTCGAYWFQRDQTEEGEVR